MQDGPILPVVIGSTLIDALVAAVVLLGFPVRRTVDGQGSPRIGMIRVLFAVMATGTVFGIKAAILWEQGIRLFGMIHLVYVDLVVLIPAIGVSLLFLAIFGQRWRKPTTLVTLASLASLGLIGVGVYATWLEPYNLKLETAKLKVSTKRDGLKPVKIGVMTDLQTNGVGEHERRAVDLLMAQKPDVILIPGDVFQGSDVEFQATKSALGDLLAKLRAPGGVFLVLGDTDGPGDYLREILPETSIRLLVNEVAEVSINGRKLTIGGVELAFRTGAPQAIVHRLETEPGDGDIRILLAHRPDVALGLPPRSRIDLVVAGHTHGGQIVVPGYGPPVTLSKVPRNVAAGGLHQITENPIYVSRGVGCEHGEAPRVRFLCPPEVSIVEIAGADLNASSPAEAPRKFEGN